MEVEKEGTRAVTPASTGIPTTVRFSLPHPTPPLRTTLPVIVNAEISPLLLVLPLPTRFPYQFEDLSRPSSRPEPILPLPELFLLKVFSIGRASNVRF